MSFFINYLRLHRKQIIIFFGFCLVFAVTFYLYHLPVQAIIYPSLVCGAIGILLILLNYIEVYKKHKELIRLSTLAAEEILQLPAVSGIYESDYQNIISALKEQKADAETKMNLRYLSMIDYYTVWAHQIKTPIAAMRLNLQNEDSPLSRRLSSDLMRIEQYVEMVLVFLRLDSQSSDYVIKRYEIDDIIRPVVRQFASEFIGRKLSLNYQPLNTKVLTDEKWLSFVIGQILSNALKYTNSGGISITLENPKTLCITDTGIGIAPEDLPRIFEKGYTGYNGRSDKKASGIGLYLCRRICKNLNHKITAESKIGKGTTIKIELAENKIRLE